MMGSEPISPDLFEKFPSKRLRQVLLSTFKNRPELLKPFHPASESLTSTAHTTVVSLELTWVQAPYMDYHKHEYSFSLIIHSGQQKVFFSKIALLHKKGVAVFEILTTDSEATRMCFQHLKQLVWPKPEFDLARSPDSYSLRTRNTIEKVLLPFHARPLLEEERHPDRNFFERHRQKFGYGILIFSILFFLLINPGQRNE